ncbi:MAG: F0F1 ATP synthase subunit alpha, partial [Actinomycetota bacterium]
MALKIDSNRIASLINNELKTYKRETRVEEVGKVMMAGDGIARISGLSKAMAGEMLQFPGNVYGV